MRLIPILLLIAASSAAALAQDALNMTLLGHLPYAQNLSDVRGAFHNGREYALVGVFNGFSIVDVSDPSAPFEVFFEPGGNSTWRDPFYYNGHAYCVNETSGGLLIVDMGPLPPPGTPPAVTGLPVTYYTGNLFPWTTAHNISFDGQGHAYIYGSNYGVGGTIILDCSQNPAAPVELGVWNEFYVHDGFVRGDTLWAACVFNGFAAAVDISDPSSPQVLTTWGTPSNFTHNIWPSDDNSTVFTTDEVSSGFITAYDVTDLGNVVELDRVNHPLSEGVIPHNVHYIDGYLVTSHYRDGVTVHDASDPSNIVLTGYYDSSPLSGAGFNGSWGAWPYLPSGIVLNADIEQGLFILAPQYTRAARIEGTVTSASNGMPLSAVMVTVSGTSISEVTGIDGTYASGLAAGGTFEVTFIKGGYLPVTVTDVELTNGQTTLLDVEMTPDIPFTLQVNVTEAGSGSPIEGATITFVNNLFDITSGTDADGLLVDEGFFDGTYEVTVGHWGHVTQCTTLTLTDLNSSIAFALDRQYYDDFAFDFGWEVTGSATTGIWVRDVPIATFFQGQMVNPGSDAGLGCGNSAFVTGNAGPPVNIDDVDDGETILTSPPMDLTGMTDPILTFHYWFYTGGGSSPSNDEMLVRISNGIDMVTLESLETTNSSWQPAAFHLSDVITLTDEMRVQFFIQDLPPGHLVEGGIDYFIIQEGSSVSEQAVMEFLLFPNPVSGGEVSIALPGHSGNFAARVLDLSGREVIPTRQLQGNPAQMAVPRHSGIYLVELTVDGNRSFRRMVVASN